MDNKVLKVMAAGFAIHSFNQAVYRDVCARAHLRNVRRGQEGKSYIGDERVMAASRRQQPLLSQSVSVTIFTLGLNHLANTCLEQVYQIADEQHARKKHLQALSVLKK